MRETSRTFRAMNTDILVIVATPAEQCAQAETALSDVEALFAGVEAAVSRFRPESELSRLNRSAGRPFVASPLLFTLVAEALEAARATGGLFDPTILGALVAAGYDRSFELLSLAHGAPTTRPAGGRAHTWRDVCLDARSRTIILPPGSGLDLGGIGKGWAADRAARRLRLFGNYAVDAGGDISVGGVQGDGGPWAIGIEDPRHPGSDLAVIGVRDGAVATSTSARRRWSSAGKERHHLIDPRTGLPAESEVISATVTARSAARAEVLAKAALLLGPELGLRFLEEQPDAEGLLVLTGGETRVSSHWGEIKYVA